MAIFSPERGGSWPPRPLPRPRPRPRLLGALSFPVRHFYSVVVWYLEKETPIFKSKTYRASTETLSLKLGSYFRSLKDNLISFSAIELNLARYTLYSLERGIFFLQMSRTSKQMFSPSLSQSNHKTMKSIYLETVARWLATGRDVLSSLRTVGASNSSTGSILQF